MYHTHDNRGRPFRVTVEAQTVKVHQLLGGLWENGAEYGVEPVHSWECLRIMIGQSTGNDLVNTFDHGPQCDGNSILLELENRYVFIGHEVYEFTPTDTILRFSSPIGNNDVPYAYAVGTQYSYLLSDALMIPNEEVPIWDLNPYEEGFRELKREEYFSKYLPLERTILQERLPY